MKDLSFCFDRYSLPGFSIAAEDLCLKEDFELFDGTIFRKGTKYFTYPDIKVLLWHLKSTGRIPDNCDIPTDAEYMQIIETFGMKDGESHSLNLATSLGLGFYGSIGILSKIEDYLAAPQRFHINQAIGYGITGNYWCYDGDESSGGARALWIHSSGAPAFIKEIIDNGANVGYSVRLIKRLS